MNLGQLSLEELFQAQRWLKDKLTRQRNYIQELEMYSREIAILEDAKFALENLSDLYNHVERELERRLGLVPASYAREHV